MGGGRRARRAIEARHRARRRLIRLALAATAVVGVSVMITVAANREKPADPSALPEELVAIRDTVFLEVRTVKGNTLVRTLLDVGPKDNPQAQLVDLTMPDDRSAAYFVQIDSDDVASIKRIGLDGGEPATVAPGTNPTVSHDGRMLAYLAADASAIVVLDLGRGTERRWDPTPTADLPNRTTVFDYAMSWSPDDRQLAFALIDPSEVFILDTSDTGTDLSAARRLGPPVDGPDAAWVQPVFQPGGRLAVLQSCCVEGRDQPLLIVDPDTGKVMRTERQTDHEVDRFDYSPAGNHLIYVTPIGEAYRATGSGPQILVGKDFTSVAW
ncbi:MAG TPA: hypothetical protein VMY34_06315 [Acidimicrobiales bacterium]|nr:hypothetical protein [Acidimicrobiales bacterium]